MCWFQSRHKLKSAPWGWTETACSWFKHETPEWRKTQKSTRNIEKPFIQISTVLLLKGNIFDFYCKGLKPRKRFGPVRMQALFKAIYGSKVHEVLKGFITKSFKTKSTWSIKRSESKKINCMCDYLTVLIQKRLVKSSESPMTELFVVFSVLFRKITVRTSKKYFALSFGISTFIECSLVLFVFSFLIFLCS